MQTGEIRQQWEGAATGWAHWEPIIAAWMEPATEAMLRYGRYRCRCARARPR